MSVSGLSTDQQEYGKSWSALGVVATIRAAWQWKKKETQGDTKKTISMATRLIHQATTGFSVSSNVFAAGFLSRSHGSIRIWISVLAVQHQKKRELDELSGVHLDSGEQLGELMFASSGALNIVSSTELCMLASEDHASHDA